MIAKKTTSLILIALFSIGFLLTLYPTNVICYDGEPFNFSIVGVIVRSSAGTPEIYPGSRRVYLRIEVMYYGSRSAYSVFCHLENPQGIDFSAGSGPSAPARSFDGSIPLKVENGDHVLFEYYLDISKALIPGTYFLNFTITYRLEGSGEVLEERHEGEVSVKVSNYPAAELRFIEAYLSPTSYPGSVDTNLYVTLENAGNSSVTSATFKIEQLPNGFIVKNPRASIGAVNIGERFTVRFTGILVPQDATIGSYSAVIYADLSMRTQDNVYYNSTAYVPIKFDVTEEPREDPIIVSSVSVLYQGLPAPLLPSARGVTIRVFLVNRLPDAVGGMIILPGTTSGISVRSLSGTYVNGMPSGSSCYIDITVDVDEKVNPGLITIPLRVSYVRIVSDSSFIGEQDISISVVVESPHAYLPDLSLISAYWGSPNPSPVYARSRYVPLTLRFINRGRYDVVGGVIGVSSKYLSPIKSSEALATRLLPGSYSEITLYFDVIGGAGEIPINVKAEYIFDEFGSHVKVTRDFIAYLPIEEYPAAASYLEIVSYGWQNNYNVFPRTENATFQVVIANRAPYPISGIMLYLDLPENMSSRGERTARVYVDGPIRSLSTFTASFLVTLGDVKPGRYKARLIADFILQSGGPGVRCAEGFSLNVSVNDDSMAVEFISAGWYEGSVGPNTYGAHLFISMRNNLIDTMRGAVLKISLPEGFVNAMDNSSLVRASPLIISPIPAIPQPQLQELSALLGEYLRAYQTSQAQAYSRGDILTFVIPLHILNVGLGIHKFEGNLSYIDQWGTRRSVKMMIPVAILGRTGYVSVSMSGTVNVRSRFTNTTLTIENNGTSPLYDVYIMVSPYQQMPLLIASPAVTYVGKIETGGKIEVPLTLAYNPFGFMTYVGGTTVITYGPVPLITSVIYRDASGAIKRFNNTITVVVEPFIDLLVKDVNVVSRGSSSTISGVIANLGSAIAYRVRAIFSLGDASAWSLIGDIAPADEIAFRIEVPRHGEVGILRIEYYDAFNQQFSEEMTLRVEVQQEVQPALPQEGGIGIETWIIIVAVIVFLSVAFALIYKTLKIRSTK